MISRLLSILSTAKGAAAATVIATAGVSGGVVATNTDVQNAITTTVQNTVQNVTQTAASPSASPKGSAEAKASSSGQPAVVAARNGADQKLRDVFQKDQQKLEQLRGSKVNGDDRGKLDDILKDADAKLRDRLSRALDDVAALTLGREGLEASGSPKPGGSAKPSTSPDAKASFTADAQAKIDGIVKAATADMDKIVFDAEKAVGALPTFEPGKPSDVPGGKPSDAPSGKPSTAPGGPPTTERPAPATPSPRPTPTR